MSDQKPEDHGPARPQVIDLDAEEILTEPDAPRTAAAEMSEPETTHEAEASQPPPPRPAPSRIGKGSAGALAIAALVLGLLAGGWLYRDVLSSYFPSDELSAMKVRLAAVEASGNGLARELAQLRQAADAAAEAAASAANGASAAAQDAKAAAQGVADLGARVDAIDQRIVATETALQAATADLEALRKSLSTAAPSGAGAGISPVDNAALAALGQRIDALEKDMASLTSSASQGSNGDKASLTSALSQSLSDLKAKIAAGAPYGPEQERIARMVPAAAGLDTVSAHAAEGLPNAQGLADELRAAIPALPQPAPPAAEDGSYFGTLMKSLSGVVTVRQIGEADWPGVAGRAADFAAAGELNQAISVIDAAEGEKPAALARWRERAAARLQLEAALAEVSEAVLRQLTALGGAQP